MENQTLNQTLPDLERCKLFDARIRTPFDRDRLNELGFESFHQAVGTLLLKGIKRRAVVDILAVECEPLVQNASARLGLQWSKTRREQVGTEHYPLDQPLKIKSQSLADEKKQRPCLRCGKMFIQTVRRRCLCRGCFAGAETDELSTISLKGVY